MSDRELLPLLLPLFEPRGAAEAAAFAAPEDVIDPEDDDPPRPPVPLLLHLKSVEGKKRGKP